MIYLDHKNNPPKLYGNFSEDQQKISITIGEHTFEPVPFSKSENDILVRFNCTTVRLNPKYLAPIIEKVGLQFDDFIKYSGFISKHNTFCTNYAMVYNSLDDLYAGYQKYKKQFTNCLKPTFITDGFLATPTTGYLLQEEKGVGAHFEVWSGLNLKLDKQCAIYLPTKELLESKKDLNEYFSKIIALVQKIRAVVKRVTGPTTMLQTENFPVAIGPLFECDLWSQVLDKGAGKQLIPWAKQILEMVSELHEKAKHAHLDIKIDNILIDENNELYLTDLEYCTEIGTKTDVKGTRGYKPPEAYHDEKWVISDKIDSWATGCVLHYLISGEPIFSDAALKLLKNKQFDDFNKVVEKEQLELKKQNHIIADIICHLIETDPTKRWSVSQALKYLS